MMQSSATNTTNIRLKLDVWLVHPLIYTRFANLLPQWLIWWLYKFCVRAALSEPEVMS